MQAQLTGNKIIDTGGGVGTTRPGTEGTVDRVPFGLSSLDREREQMAAQPACLAKSIFGVARSKANPTPLGKTSQLHYGKTGRHNNQ